MKIKNKKYKKRVIKRKLKFQDYKKTIQKQLVQIDVDSIKEDQKEFIKNNKLMLKTQQRF